MRRRAQKQGRDVSLGRPAWFLDMKRHQLYSIEMPLVNWKVTYKRELSYCKYDPDGKDRYLGGARCRQLPVECVKDTININHDGYIAHHYVYPVGWLDKETSGLIILTSDGRIVNAVVLRVARTQPKVCKMKLDGLLEDCHLQRLRVCQENWEFVSSVYFFVTIILLHLIVALVFSWRTCTSIQGWIIIQTVAKRKGQTEEENTLIVKWNNARSNE